MIDRPVDPLVEDALALLREGGVERFDLDVLAERRTGVVPRGDGAAEALLVRVWQHLRLQFLDRLMQATAAGMADDAFIAVYWQEARREPLTARLRERLRGVLVGPLTPRVLAEERLAMQTAIARASNQIGICLDLEPEPARDLLLSLAALVLGAEAMDIGAAGQAGGEQPEVAGSAETLAAMAAEDLFLRNAQRVLAGVRSGG